MAWLWSSTFFSGGFGRSAGFGSGGGGGASACFGGSGLGSGFGGSGGVSAFWGGSGAGGGASTFSLASGAVGFGSGTICSIFFASTLGFSAVFFAVLSPLVSLSNSDDRHDLDGHRFGSGVEPGMGQSDQGVKQHRQMGGDGHDDARIRLLHPSAPLLDLGHKRHALEPRG